MNKYPRVLVISHNVFSKSTAMGKTLSNMLSCVPPENLAQLYFHSEIPTTEVCKNYFRITDQDVLRSLISRRAHYTIYGRQDIKSDATSSRTDKGTVAKIYQFSRRRTPLIYNTRNILWKMGKWNSNALTEWINDFSPDVIFFASGDYAFSYRVTYAVSTMLHIPVIIWCCDDFYFSKRYSSTLGGKYCHRNLMKWVNRVSSLTEAVVVISDRMKQDYAKIFPHPIYTMRIDAPKNKNALPVKWRQGIVYVGSLGVNRITPLVEVGRQLKAAGIVGYEYIDVYSNDKNAHTLSLLTKGNGIRFHGGVPSEEVSRILGAAKYVLHVEAFDENSKSRTRYSLSTKIGEYLQSGACIIAYGPPDISSIKYLKENRAAVVLSAGNEFPTMLRKLNNQENTYLQFVNYAYQLAEKNHDKQKNDMQMMQIIRVVSSEIPKSTIKVTEACEMSKQEEVAQERMI